MTWEPELDELRRREELSRRMGGPERIARQHSEGRLTVRERAARLVDAGRFEACGAPPRFATYDGARLGAARVVSAHLSVMVRDTSQLFVAGPPVAKHGMRRDVGKEELGGWRIHTRESGAVDNLAEDEADALAQVRRFLTYLPVSVW